MVGCECFGFDFFVVLVDFFVLFVEVFAFGRGLVEEFVGVVDVFEDGDVFACVAGFAFENEVEYFDECAEG